MKLEYHDDLDRIRSFDASVTTSGSLADRIARDFQSPYVRQVIWEFINAAREEWADEAWALFDLYSDVKILTVKRWFLSFTFRVKHCGIFLKLLVGERPEPKNE